MISWRAMKADTAIFDMAGLLHKPGGSFDTFERFMDVFINLRIMPFVRKGGVSVLILCNDVGNVPQKGDRVHAQLAHS